MDVSRPDSGKGSGDSKRLVRAAWVLGLGGLVPFLGLAGLLVRGEPLPVPETLVFALSGYAAAILSFLGGIRWGAAIARPDGAGVLALSVVPSLAGWALLFVPAPWSFAGFAAAFLAQGAIDVRAAGRGGLPRWFGRLRIVLTAGATLAMTAAFLATRPA